MIVRLLVAAWCFARPVPLSCDMQFPPTPKCDRAMTEAEHLERERALDHAALEAELEVEPLEDFAARVVPIIFPRLRTLPSHWRVILARMEAVRFGGIRLKINIAPRHGKTVCMLLTIAWMMRYWPSLRHAYATYGQDFSETQGRLLAKMLEAGGVRLSLSKAGVFETTAGGACYITARGGVLLGKGIDGLLGIDDPYKDRAEADSTVVQETTWDWFQDTAKSRLEGPASVILMHQRWGYEDMSGRIDEAGMAWDTLILRAINDNGEALWPEVKSLADLREEERTNAYGFATMYQQDPVPRGNAVFREPERYDVAEWLARRDFNPLEYRWCLALDPAITVKTSADHSAGLLVAYQGAGEEMRGWAVDLLHAQMEAPELIDKVIEMRRAWMAKYRIGTLPILVEGNGVGGPIYQQMVRLAPADQVRIARAATDKLTRATSFAAAWNAGRFFVPTTKAGEKWGDYVREHRRFTGHVNGKDDQVDAGAHSWNFEFRRTPTLVRGIRKVAIHGLG